VRSNGRVDPGFLQKWLSLPLMKEYMLGHSSGGTRKAITKGHLQSFPIPLPPLAEQRAIAATLGALDDKIESNRRAVTIAEQLGDALFAAAASESRLLSDVADITMGSSPKGADLNEDGDGLPFYQGTRDFGVRFPSLRVWTTAPVRTAAKSDTLMSVRAPVGELNRASADCCIGRGVAAIHSDTHPSTLYYAMRSSSSAWDKFQGEGTVFASVNKTDVHGAEIRWVGDGALFELEDKLRAIDARIESLESETQRLTALRDTLLPELLSGRMRVPTEGVAA
jgi:type I restriction enzyme S subunit